MEFPSNGAQRFRRTSPVDACRGLRQSGRVVLRVGPQTPDEALSTFDAGIRPQRGLIGRTREHGEHARGVTAVGCDQVLWIDAVLFAFRHLADAAILDGTTVTQ